MLLNGIGDAAFSLINGIVEVIGRIGFLSLASYARKHEFGSKAKVTAIAGKAS